MSRFVARNISLVLMLAAFPLISIGTMGDQPGMWWTGLASLAIGALIPPVMRYVPEEKSEKGQAVERRKIATDLGDSCRVC